MSVFEPHTQVIPRFKAGAAVKFGRKIRLDEVEGGIISGFKVLERGWRSGPGVPAGEPGQPRRPRPRWRPRKNENEVEGEAETERAKRPEKKQRPMAHANGFIGIKSSE